MTRTFRSRLYSYRKGLDSHLSVPPISALERCLDDLYLLESMSENPKSKRTRRRDRKYQLTKLLKDFYKSEQMPHAMESSSELHELNDKQTSKA